jgi:predicted Zn-dependent protease
VTAALEIARAALAHAHGDAEALVHVESSGLARFADSQVDQPTLIADTIVRVRCVSDGKLGAAGTNRIDREGLTQVARRAAEAAASAPRDPDFPGLAPKAAFPEVDGYDEATATLGAEEQARLAAAAIAASELPLYGFFTSGVTELAIASSTGIEAEQQLTDATALAIAADERRSGYADATSWRVDDLDVGSIAQEAAEKAARTGGAKEIGVGVYPAVLEPYAVADLLDHFAYDSLGGLGLLEERGYFTGRIGELVFDEKISIADDALDSRGLPKAFDFEGSPKQRVELVSNGLARGVVWDRVTAGRAHDHARSTGHAPPTEYASWGPLPHALCLDGGQADSIDELAAAIGDGLYITRLHYLGVVQPREGVITGMTRDGTFRVRDGRIAEPLLNLRFTVSVPELLREVPGLTRDVKLVNASAFYSDRYPHGLRVPALATTRFHVTGVGSGPGI